MMVERKWTLALSPLALFIPLVTLGCWLREIAFGQHWTLRTGSISDEPVQQPQSAIM